MGDGAIETHAIPRAGTAIQIAISICTVAGNLAVLLWAISAFKTATDMKFAELDRDIAGLDRRMVYLETDREPGLKRWADLHEQLALLTQEMTRVKEAIEAKPR